MTGHALDDHVVLLDPSGNPTGVADKATVHAADTPLHWAFSCHLRNRTGQWLLTRRALTKVAWPGVWSNAFCGHPAPGEQVEEAIVRRAMQELGISVRDLELILPDFRYAAVDPSGVRENEVCPVYAAITDDDPTPSRDEIIEHLWAEPADVTAAVAHAPWAFSPWFGWQLEQLQSPQIAAGQQLSGESAP